MPSTIPLKHRPRWAEIRTLTNAELESACKAEPTAKALLRQAGSLRGLSARAYHRVQRVSRTIADLEARASVLARHVGKALQFRGGGLR